MRCPWNRCIFKPSQGIGKAEGAAVSQTCGLRPLSSEGTGGVFPLAESSPVPATARLPTGSLQEQRGARPPNTAGLSLLQVDFQDQHARTVAERRREEEKQKHLDKIHRERAEQAAREMEGKLLAPACWAGLVPAGRGLCRLGGIYPRGGASAGAGLVPAGRGLCLWGGASLC